MNSMFPGHSSIPDDFDGDLVLLFLTEFHALEQALLRAGYTRAGRLHRSTQPDWIQFVRQIEPQFHPERSPELQGAVSYLLADPQKVKARRKRLEDSLPGEAYGVEQDIVWLAELIVEARNKLTNGIPILDENGFDTAYVTAVMLIVQDWSRCDPTIKKLLAHGE